MSTIGDVTGTMSVDTAQFEAGMKRAAAAAAAAGASSEAAAKAEKRNADSVAAAAKYAGDTITDKGKRIVAVRAEQVQSANDIRKLEYDLKNGYLSEAEGLNALTAAIQRNIAQKQEMAALTAAERHGGFTQQQGASAFLRGGGMRAEERFLAMIPGVGAGLQSIGAAFGGVALLRTLVEVSEKVYDFDQRMKHAGDTARDAWSTINTEVERTGASLAVAGDKLDITLAKLEHKPADFLKLTLDEDRKALADVAAEADAAQKKIAAIFKENGVSNMQQWEQTALDVLKRVANVETYGLFRKHLQSGIQMSTKDDEDAINGTEKILKRVREQASARLADTKPGVDAEAVDKANRSTQLAALDHAIADAKVRLQGVYGLQRKNAGGPEDYSDRTAMEEGYLADLQDRRSTLAQEFHNSDTQSAVDRRERQKADATAAAEAARKAAEAQFRGMEEMLASRKATEQMSVVDTLNFWEAQIKPAERYPENLRKVKEKVGSAYQEYLRMLGEMASKAQSVQVRMEEEQMRLAEELDRRMDRADKSGADAQADLTAAYAKSAGEMDKLTLAHDVATGAISKYDQAVQIAKIHQAEFAAQIERLRAQQAAIENDGDMLRPEKDAAKQKLQAQIVLVQGEADRQGRQDQWGVQAETALGGFTAALEKATAAGLDYASITERLTSSTLSETNSTILQMLTTRGRQQPHPWEQLGGNIARNVAGAGLSTAEGQILKAFHIGGKKTAPAGTATDPLYVRSAGGADASSSTAGFVSKLFGGSKGDAGGSAGDSGSTAGSMIGSVLGTVLGFAGGGDPPLGRVSIVGEDGPELFVPKQAGTIIPNGGAASMFTRNAGGAGAPIYVDARGSESPAMAEAAARRGAMAGAAMGRAMAGQDRADSDRRRLGGVRRS